MNLKSSLLFTHYIIEENGKNGQGFYCYIICKFVGTHSGESAVQKQIKNAEFIDKGFGMKRLPIGLYFDFLTTM